MIKAIRSLAEQMSARVAQPLHRIGDFADRNHMVLLWIIAILYKFVLDVLYIWVASPLYAYAGLTYVPNFLKYVIAFGMYFLMFAYLPKDERSVSAVLLHVQFAYIVAPMLTFYAFANGSNKYMLMVFICIIFQIFVARRGKGKQNPVYLKGLSSYVTVGLGVLMVAALAIPVLYNGFEGLKAFDFSYIYEMRANATYPPGFSYLFSWMSKAIVPFAAVMFLDKKRYGWAGLMVFLQVLMYMECGNKYVLFIIVPVIAVYYCAKSGHLIKLMYVGLCLLFLLLIPAYLMDIKGGHRLGVLGSFYVAVRAVFHPADNKFAMYECFSQFPKIFYSNGLIGKMLGLTYLYAGSEGQIIHAYNGGQFMSASMNTGYLGESYAQMGFVGMMLMSGLFGLILRAVESYNCRKTFCILTAVFVMFIINLNDIPLLTTIMSSGLAVILILAAVYLRKEKEEI